MAKLLNDIQLKSLVGTVILKGEESCVRSNSYVLRLGAEGEFINTNKEFNLGAKKKGIIVPAGHSVGLTSLETLDFSRDVVHKLFPGCDLYGLLSPSTDLSREGVVAPSTHVDAGYHGTINWTITNSSSEERKFMYGERLFRLAIFKLEEGETPEFPYSGGYQSKLGYIRSQRRGAPMGMKESEWEVAHKDGGPESLLEDLIKSGFPWNILGSRLKAIDMQFETITNEYGAILDSIGSLSQSVKSLKNNQEGASNLVKNVLVEEMDNLHNRWTIKTGAILMGLAGLVLAIFSSNRVLGFFTSYGGVIGPSILVLSVITWIYMSRNRKNKN